MFFIALLATAQISTAKEPAHAPRKPASTFKANKFGCTIGSGDLGSGDDGTGLTQVMEASCDVNKPFSVSNSERHYVICCTGKSTLPN